MMRVEKWNRKRRWREIYNKQKQNEHEMAEPLTDEEIRNISYLWRSMSNVSYFETIHKSRRLAPYFAQLQHHPVLDIGPGENPVTNHFPCKEYRSAENYFPQDGLSVLKKMGDKSAIVVSFGVIDDSILLTTRNATLEQLTTRYIDELVQQIRRVMNPFAIIFGQKAQKYMGEPDMDITSPSSGGVYFQK
jgi:hypothetical protein